MPQDRSAEATQRLGQLRAQLAQCEAEEQEADAAMDAARVTTARQQAATLREFITRTEREVTALAQAAVQGEAVEWLAGHDARMARAKAKLSTASDAIRPHIEAALRAIAAEQSARAEFDTQNDAALVLALRFGLPAPHRPVPPPVADHITALFDAFDAMRTPRRQRRLSVNAAASATAEQRRVLTLHAVHEFIGKYRTSLPVEVRAMLDAAPITDVERGERGPTPVSAHEQREAQRMADAVRDTQRTLASFSGSVAGVGM
jgi:hypothetical protein